MKVALLGAGRVGSAIARDLADSGDFSITVADVSRMALDRLAERPEIRTITEDLSDPSVVAGVVSGCDLVVGAVPGPMGFETLQAVIRTGVDVVDISFFEEDPAPLDELAKEHGVVAVMDCGVAPGCSNLILGHCEATFDEVTSFSCWVGGLPVVRHWPYEYRSVFSPIDVIAEYTRPARLVANGHVVTREALSEIELLEVTGVGTLEAFNTDGLRTLLTTSSVPNMKEKTMRYPGHAEMMRMLRDTGFFGDSEVAVGEVAVRPLDLTARLLAEAWRLKDGEEDLTAMRVEVEGRVGGVPVRHVWELLDRFDRVSNTTSMARTTGYTCSAGVQLVAQGLVTEAGLVPPELLGRDPRCFGAMMAYLEQRGVVFDHRVEEVG
jgi:saccharopine dehydrogenase-like NADP-dependent oxidoreductase